MKKRINMKAVRVGQQWLNANGNWVAVVEEDKEGFRLTVYSLKSDRDYHTDGAGVNLSDPGLSLVRLLSVE